MLSWPLAVLEFSLGGRPSPCPPLEPPLVLACSNLLLTHFQPPCMNGFVAWTKRGGGKEWRDVWLAYAAYGIPTSSPMPSEHTMRLHRLFQASYLNCLRICRLWCAQPAAGTLCFHFVRTSWCTSRADIASPPWWAAPVIGRRLTTLSVRATGWRESPLDCLFTRPDSFIDFGVI